jgi:hypothetical protein
MLPFQATADPLFPENGFDAVSDQVYPSELVKIVVPIAATPVTSQRDPFQAIPIARNNG